MARPACIYALVDPRDSQIRYVGQTERDPAIRLAHHLKDKEAGKLRIAWIDELASMNLVPSVMVLELTDTDQANAIETQWIDKLRGDGCSLLNAKNVPCNRNNSSTRRRIRREELKRRVGKRTTPAPTFTGCPVPATMLPASLDDIQAHVESCDVCRGILGR